MTRRQRQIASDVALSLVLIATTAVLAPKLWDWAPRTLAGEEAHLDEDPANGISTTDDSTGEAAVAPGPGLDPPDALGFVTTTLPARLTEPTAGLLRRLAPDRVIRVDEDGTAEFTLGIVDDRPAPVDILSEPAQGELTRRGNGRWRYRPADDTHGLDEFGYQVCLGTRCEQGVVLLTVASLNDPPTAVDDEVVVGSARTVRLTPSGNDVDPDGPSELTIVAVGVPIHGTTVLRADGAIDYRAPELLPGPDDYPSVLDDMFTYVVCDAPGGCSSATVRVTIGPG